jgi:hypothetical protein
MCNFDFPDLSTSHVEVFQHFGIHFSRLFQGILIRSDVAPFAILFLSREFGRNMEARLTRLESVFTVQVVGWCDYFNGFPDEPEH